MNFSSITLLNRRLRSIVIIVMLRWLGVNQVLELVVRSLVRVVEVSRVQRVGTCERIVNLALLAFGSPKLGTFLVTVN